jgi:hypothetical protein
MRYQSGMISLACAQDSSASSTIQFCLVKL